MSVFYATYEVDVLAAARRVASDKRGALTLAVIEIEALAEYVLRAEQKFLEIEQESDDGNTDRAD